MAILQVEATWRSHHGLEVPDEKAEELRERIAAGDVDALIEAGDVDSSICELVDFTVGY